jgi:radical SAM protein with 4Fe4S-binding SPASM domain
MCGQWGEEGSSRKLPPESLKTELSLNQLQSIIDDIKFYKPNITLFGGEPLLYNEWTDLVRYIKKAGLRCNIISNGILLEKYAEDIVNLGVNEIIFSLDGDPEVHDKIRGTPGVFEKASGGLKAIHALKRKNQSRTPLINISSTIFETNYKNLEKIVAVAEDLSACSITFHHLIFLSNQTYNQHNELFLRLYNVACQDWRGFVRSTLPAIDVSQLIDTINRLKKGTHRTNVLFYPNLTEEEIRQYYTNFNFRPSSYKHRCVSPWMVAYIFPDGSVRPCQSLNYVAGNIKEDSFKNIWNNHNSMRFRSITKKNKLYPVCYRCTELYRF